MEEMRRARYVGRGTLLSWHIHVFTSLEVLQTSFWVFTEASVHWPD